MKEIFIFVILWFNTYKKYLRNYFLKVVLKVKSLEYGCFVAVIMCIKANFVKDRKKLLRYKIRNLFKNLAI